MIVGEGERESERGEMQEVGLKWSEEGMKKEGRRAGKATMIRRVGNEGRQATPLEERGRGRGRGK